MLQQCYSFLFGMLGCLIVFIAAHLFNPASSTIGTVNITGIINHFIKQESNKNLSPDLLKQEVRQFGNQLEVILRQLAKEKHITLFPSEAVIAGSQDYTDVVNQKMKLLISS
jgi:Flp pilus assembly protein TadB